MDTKQPSSSDTKVFAVLGYIIPVLFFIPLLNEKMKDVPSVRFHANQQLLLLVGYIALVFAGNLFFIGPILLIYFALQLLQAVLFVLSMYGAYYAYKDQQKELPLIGHIRLLK